MSDSALPRPGLLRTGGLSTVALLVTLALAAGPVPAGDPAPVAAPVPPAGDPLPGDRVATAGHVGAADHDANVTVYRAANATFDDAAAVEAAVADGRLSPADHAVVGETLVVAIDSARLAGALAAHNGTLTERFLAALDGDAQFRIVQLHPDTMVSRKIARVGRANATVLRANETTYVLVDTGALEFGHYDPDGTNRPDQVRDDDLYAAEFGFDLQEPSLGGSYDPAGPSVDFVTTRAEFLDFEDFDRLPPAQVARSVHVNVPPEESLVVRVTLEGGRTVTAPADAPMTEFPEMSLDLRNATPRTRYTAALVHDGRVVDRLNGTVVERSASFRDPRLTRVDGQSVLNVTVRLSHGGSVEVLNDECEELGTRGVHTDPPGTATRLSIPLDGEVTRGILVRAHQEEYADRALYPGTGARTYVGFGGFECGGSAATEPGTATGVAPETVTVTATATDAPGSSTVIGTPTPTSAPTSEAQVTDLASPTRSRSSSSGVPGFGAVGAMVAVGVAALGLWRR